MLILLPPSEGKTAPRSGAPLDLDALALADADGVTSARRELLARLAEVSARDDAATLLGVGASLADEVAANTRLDSAPAAPARRVYTGVLFEALDLASLSPAARRRAGTDVLISSALFGATTPADRVPAYRLPIGARLPDLPGLAAWWRPVLAPALDAHAASRGGPVVDCRSGGYAAQWRAPAERTLTVDVFQLRGGEPTVVSHHAKHTRGLVARALLEAGPRAAGTLERAADVVARAGAADGPHAWEVDLVPPAGRRPGSLRVVLPEG
ncbi:YaaA family protein [Micrococcus lacusdianchii]|uniref:YaaA family protein n=1 Tax=Micrococcus lacusdianchii TaxID=2915940 RepID=UPI0020049AB1|nr:peroxide stress protein YaaA [Micrococcus sp. JXJ CY 30]